MSKGKRVSAFVTAGVMALTTAAYFPQPVMAADSYFTCDGQEISNLYKVKGTCEMTGDFTGRLPISKDTTLNLNGHTLDGDGGRAIEMTGGTLTLTGEGAVVNGKVFMMAGYDSSLVVDGPTVSEVAMNTGTVEVKSGTITKLTKALAGTGTVTITGGTINEISGNQTGYVISGGVFGPSVDLTGKVADGYEVYTRDDGMQAVEKSVTAGDVQFPTDIEMTEGDAPINVIDQISVNSDSERINYLFSGVGAETHDVFEVGRYNGTLTAVKAGEGKLIAVVRQGDREVVRTSTVNVKVNARFTDFTVNNGSQIEVDKRSSVNLADLMEINPEMDANDIDWTVTAEHGTKYVTIDGLTVTGYGVTGQYETLTVTGKDRTYGTEITKTVTVKVLPILDSFEVVNNNIVAYQGDEPVALELSTNHKSLAQNIDSLDNLILNWETSDRGVATVNTGVGKAGKVEFGKAGTATITGTMAYKNATKTATVDVTVKPVIKSVDVNDEAQTLYVNTTDEAEKTFELSAPTVIDKAGDSIDLSKVAYEFYSDNENVATVNGNTVTATGEGTAHIYVKAHLTEGDHQEEVVSTSYVTVEVKSAFESFKITNGTTEVKKKTVREGKGVNLTLEVERDVADVTFQTEAEDGVTATVDGRTLKITTDDNAGNEVKEGRKVTVKVTPVVNGEALTDAAKTLTLKVMPRLKAFSVDKTALQMDATQEDDITATVNSGVNAKYGFEVLSGDGTAEIVATETGFKVKALKEGTMSVKLTADNARADLPDEQKEVYITIDVEAILDVDSVKIENAVDGVINVNEFDTDKSIEIGYDVLGADELPAPFTATYEVNGNVAVSAGGLIDTSVVGESEVIVKVVYHSANTGTDYAVEVPVKVKVNSVLRSVTLQQNGREVSKFFGTYTANLDEDAGATEYDLVTNAVNGQHAAAEFSVRSNNDSAVKAEIVDGKLVLTPQEVTGLSTATVTVTATSPDGAKTVTTRMIVTVNNVLQKIEVQDVTLDEATSSRVHYTVDANQLAFTSLFGGGRLSFSGDYTSDDFTITRDLLGRYNVNAKKAGTYEVTATATYGGRTVTDTFTVTVKPVLAEITVNAGSAVVVTTEGKPAIDLLGRYTLTSKGGVDMTGNPDVAVVADLWDAESGEFVSVDGMDVTPLKEGQGLVRLSAIQGSTTVEAADPILVYVRSSVNQIENADQQITTKIGQEIPLALTANGTVYDYTFGSSDEELAHVEEDEDGNFAIVTGEKTGTALIYVNVLDMTEYNFSDDAMRIHEEGLPMPYTIAVTVEKDNYDIIAGDLSSKTVGDGQVLVISANGEFRHFKDLYVTSYDGVAEWMDAHEDDLTEDHIKSKFGAALSSDLYDVVEGSTVATLHADYLDGLTPGDYALAFAYNDGGVAIAKFTVKAKPTATTASVKVKKPNTGAYTGEVTGAVMSTGVVVGVATVLAGVWLAIRRKMMRK